MTVDILLRVKLTPDAKGVTQNAMLADLKTYVRLKEQDDTLQCNATKIKIESHIMQVVRLDR